MVPLPPEHMKMCCLEGAVSCTMLVSYIFTVPASYAIPSTYEDVEDWGEIGKGGKWRHQFCMNKAPVK